MTTPYSVNELVMGIIVSTMGSTTQYAGIDIPGNIQLGE